MPGDPLAAVDVVEYSIGALGRLVARLGVGEDFGTAGRKCATEAPSGSEDFGRILAL